MKPMNVNGNFMNGLQHWLMTLINSTTTPTIMIMIVDVVVVAVGRLVIGLLRVEEKLCIDPRFECSMIQTSYDPSETP